MSDVPEKWLTLPGAMRVWHGIALTPPERRTSGFAHAAQVLDAQANEVAIVCDELDASGYLRTLVEARVAALAHDKEMT